MTVTETAAQAPEAAGGGLEADPEVLGLMGGGTPVMGGDGLGPGALIGLVLLGAAAIGGLAAVLLGRRLRRRRAGKDSGGRR
ncbi:MAG: hypothetical protein AAF074_22815 [Pseudomonadota bacterium]